MGRGYCGRILSFFFEGLRLTWIRRPWKKGTVWAAVDWPKWTKNMGSKCHNLDVMYVSGPALITWTKCPFFCGLYERFWGGLTVCPLSCLGCSVKMDIAYMGCKIQWTIYAGRSVTRTGRTWTIHHSTPASCSQ
jgi:hypothetical protein